MRKRYFNMIILFSLKIISLQPTPVFLPGKSHGDRGPWRNTVHGVTKELDMTERLNNSNNMRVIPRKDKDANSNIRNRDYK